MNERNIKCFKIFGKNWYPALMMFQLGFHLAAIPIFIISLVLLFKGDLYAIISVIVTLAIESLSFIWAFDEELADKVNKNGFPPIDLDF